MEGSKATILVVDDEEVNRSLLGRSLRLKYQTVEAGTVAEAIACLEQSSAIHLILCDYLMPGGLGTELAVVVKERWPHLRFILLTGYDTDSSIQAGLDAGAICEVVLKPWRSRRLREVIGKWILPVSE